MTLYFANYKGADRTEYNLKHGEHHYIDVNQSFITKIIVVGHQVFDWHLYYPNIDAFLSDWNELEYEATDNDLVGRLVGI